MTKINLPDNSYILYALAGANAIGFAWASIAIEGDGGGLIMTLIFAARGILLGLASGFGMASISNKIPRAAKAAMGWGYLGLGIIGLAAPVMMSPVIYARLETGVLSFLPWEVRLAMAIAVGILSDGLILGVAATSGKLQAEEKPLESVPVAKSKPAKPAFVCSTCGYEAKSEHALSGHQGKHSKKKAKVVGYVATFEPVTNKEQTK